MMMLGVVVMMVKAVVAKGLIQERPNRTWTCLFDEDAVLGTVRMEGVVVIVMLVVKGAVKEGPSEAQE